MVEIINMIKIIIEYLCQNFAKTQKNNMNSNLIFIAMNGQFSLRWNFIAKISLIAMNSLFADKYRYKLLDSH